MLEESKCNFLVLIFLWPNFVVCLNVTVFWGRSFVNYIKHTKRTMPLYGWFNNWWRMLDDSYQCYQKWATTKFYDSSASILEYLLEILKLFFLRTLSWMFILAVLGYYLSYKFISVRIKDNVSQYKMLGSSFKNFSLFILLQFQNLV